MLDLFNYTMCVAVFSGHKALTLVKIQTETSKAVGKVSYALKCTVLKIHFSLKDTFAKAQRELFLLGDARPQPAGVSCYERYCGYSCRGWEPLSTAGTVVLHVCSLTTFL